MSSGDFRQFRGVAGGGRQPRRQSGGRGVQGNFDARQSQRSGGGRFGVRSSRVGVSYRGGSRRGGSVGSSHYYDDVPITPKYWLKKLEKDGPHAFMDFSLCFAGTKIPFLKAMGIDLMNMSYVAGQEVHAIMIAACQSMISGCMVFPDGSKGRKIGDHLLDDEAARLDAGG